MIKLLDIHNMKISIITATFNRGHFIEPCILSILRQNIKDIELIIIDGLSTDSTSEKLEPLIKKNKNIKFYSETDLGIYDALNKGIDKASGDIIGFLHSDDLFYNSEVLNDIINTIKNNDLDGIYGDLEYVEKINTNKVLRYWQSCIFSKKLLRKGWTPPHPTLFLKKEVYKKHGKFDLKFNISADYDFMLRVFNDESLNIDYIPKVITRMRVGGISNKNIKNIILKTFEDYKAIRKNEIGSIGTLVRKNTSKIKQFFNKRD
jgi:glycosyltransferase